MKKILLASLATMMVTGGFYLNFKMQKTDKQISDLTLANIEAVANLLPPEVGGGPIQLMDCLKQLLGPPTNVLSPICPYGTESYQNGQSIVYQCERWERAKLPTSGPQYKCYLPSPEDPGLIL